jgi:hypothetical protein
MASLNLTDNSDERNHDGCEVRDRHLQENLRLHLESNTVSHWRNRVIHEI